MGNNQSENQNSRRNQPQQQVQNPNRSGQQGDQNSIQRTQEQQQVINRLYSNNQLNQPAYLESDDFYLPGVQRIYIVNNQGQRRSEPTNNIAEIKQVQAVKIVAEMYLNKDSVVLLKNSVNPNLRGLTFKFTFEVEAAISVWYAGSEQVEQTTLITILTESQNQNYLPNRHYKFQPGKDLDYPIELYPLDLTQFSSDSINKQTKYNYPLIIKFDKIDKRQENKCIYFYFKLNEQKDGSFKGQLVQQKIEYNGRAQILDEAYGINDTALGQSTEEGKECLICMSDKPDTMILPCKHICICYSCCLSLREKTNKCPICRSGIVEYIRLTKAEIQQSQVQQTNTTQ